MLDETARMPWAVDRLHILARNERFVAKAQAGSTSRQHGNAGAVVSSR
jgi:hypothetical protein